MKILITGSNGLIGQHLIKLLLSNTEHAITATGKGAQRTSFNGNRFQYLPLDICDGMAVNELIGNVMPDIIIHAAAVTQADACELNPIACYNANVTATRFFIDAAKKFNAFLIFMSTDFVFDGNSGPYREDAATNPVSYYGSTKVAAEKAVAELGAGAAIVRTCLVYGNMVAGTRGNIISWVKENLEQAKTIKVVSDQWRTPTYVEDLAKGILLIAEKKAAGIYNLSGKDFMSPYEMALATAAYLQLDASLIVKTDASLFTQPAKRPATTGFTIDKATKALGFAPISFKEGLQKMLG